MPDGCLHYGSQALTLSRWRKTDMEFSNRGGVPVTSNQSPVNRVPDFTGYFIAGSQRDLG